MIERLRPSDIPNAVFELCHELEKRGHRAWIVGGCLRDLLRGKPAADWDLATSARPEQVQSTFPRVFPTGIQHGTVTVRHRGQSYEVTTLRGEGAYSDGRRPDSVEFVDSIEADLARRDFTINAMAYDPVTDSLVDPFGGLHDLQGRVIRAVGQAEERFSEDGLRVLRAARFAASLGFELAPETEAAVRPTLGTFRRVSPERVREEWLKAFKAEIPSRAFAIMERTGILEITLESLAQLLPETFSWALAALDAAPREAMIRLAALLSPLADRPQEVADWLTAYRFSNHERERVLRMLQFVFMGGSEHYSDSDVRRFARKVTREALREVVGLHVLCARARFGEASTQAKEAVRLQGRVAELVSEATPLTAKELALGGRELMQGLGVAPGPQVGRLIEHLLEAVLDDPSLNTKERLLERARERLAGRRDVSGFIDLHLHIVPSVDDGVRSLEESLTVCRGLKQLGFDHLVTTPHIRRGMFENRKANLTEAFEQFKAQVASEPDMPALSLSAEHHCDDLFLELFKTGELLPYPGGRALLLEFANEALPLGIQDLAFKLRLKGFTPVVAHPERYVPLSKRTDPIDPLLEQEVAFQLDVMSLVGKYGRNARNAAERMLEEGVYAIAASDCHGPADLERTRDAIERMVELVGKAEAQLLLGENPARLLSGKAIQ